MKTQVKCTRIWWKILVVLFLITGPCIAQSRHEDLSLWYASYNHVYFNDSLPAKVVVSYNLTDQHYKAQTEYTVVGDGYIHLEFNPYWLRDSGEARLVLLHEMCHVQLKTDRQAELDMHGPKFQSCMHHLVEQGAMDDLW